MRTLGIGVALAVLGIVLTFSNLLGFVAGLPLLAVGLVLIAAGALVGGYDALTGRGRTRGRRLEGRRGHL